MELSFDVFTNASDRALVGVLVEEGHLLTIGGLEVLCSRAMVHHI